MSRQIGSLHRLNSHPANLQNPLPIIPLFAFPPLDSPQANTSSGINSDTNSDMTIYTTISQFNNSDIETPDEFADSEPSPSTHTPTSSTTFSKPPFQPIQSHSQHAYPYTPSQVTPTYSPFNNDRSTNISPDKVQISEELDNFITLQQQNHSIVLTVLIEFLNVNSQITHSHPNQEPPENLSKPNPYDEFSPNNPTFISPIYPKSSRP